MKGIHEVELHYRSSFMLKRSIRHILYIYFRFTFHQRSVRWGSIMDRSDDLHFLEGISVQSIDSFVGDGCRGDIVGQ